MCNDAHTLEMAEMRQEGTADYYRKLVEALPVAVYTTDSAGRITFYNEAAVALWGRRPTLGRDEWCGSWKLRWPDGTPMAHDECPMAQAVLTDRPIRDAEAIAERSDGSHALFVPYPTPLHDQEGALIGAVNVLVDVTARKIAEDALTAANLQLQRLVEERSAELMQAQKMEIMGQLTSGVAHDFNNVLHGIGSCMAALEVDIVDDDARHLLAAARQGIEQGRRLTQYLLTFARRQALAPQSTDIAAVLGRVRPILEHSMGGLIRIETDVAAGLWPTLVDPTQIELAILNLAINARDAMPLGGRINIHAGNVTVERCGKPGHPVDLLPGDYVVVSVADTGGGMDAETLDRACEPFFTTKEAGKGSGLGLSMVRGMAVQCGGGLHIRSREGCGTVVAVYLPRVAPTAVEAAPAPPAQAVKGSGSVVLLVDDDELVRIGMAAVLEALGYRVVSADSGEAALRMLYDGTEVDVLVTDYAMPGISGAMLVREARGLHPRLPVLMMTGYADRPEEVGPVALIQKPFQPGELAVQLAGLVGRSH